MNNSKFFGLAKTFLDCISIVFIFIVLVIPNNIEDITFASFFVVPFEAIILGLLLFFPRPIGVLFRWLASAILALGVLLTVADIATYQVFARTFNPIFDAYLLVNGMHLLNGAVGTIKAVMLVLLLIFIVAMLIGLIFLTLGRVSVLVQRKPYFSGPVLILALVVYSLFLWKEWGGVAVRFYSLLDMHFNETLAGINELKTFHVEVDKDFTTTIPNENLFSKLKGKDVLLVFIESYGRTVLDKPEFAEHVRPLLQKATEDLHVNGLSARSAYLTSPTFGGLSWLAHGTALSGLWINSQVRYDTLMMSQRASLNRLFKRAGWRTAAVVPAITMAWPESQYFGYDQIYTGHDLGYSGKPFNWITMPDQYTLSAFQARERNSDHAPVMTEMALISSHAPWTPIPQLVDWSVVGNGTIFNEQAAKGDSPDIVWQDNDRIRTQYRLSIEYVLQTLVSYAVHYGDDNLVILAFGDHQPAPLVTGNTDNRDVIVHLIARDSKIMEAIAGWNWTDGMLPTSQAPVWRMDEVREKLINTFSSSLH